MAEYGKTSGLWEDLAVKRKGKAASDPFQIFVNVAGQEHNVIDVGYGVSQALPLLIDSIEALEGATLLLQQPDIHLHPRAQAALGTFLGKVAKRERKRFLIETHSDYLIDRVRMDVRDAKGKDALKPEDVLILYFERDRGHVNIHPIHVGQNGELLDVPPGYRSFFLAEERRMLGL
jgi:predicted ATPase